MRPLRVALAVAATSVVMAATALPSAFATHGVDTRVSIGSPVDHFAQNKQNEPALAVDANHPNVLAAGANEEIDVEACNAGADDTCPFTAGVGTSGVYFSLDSGDHWVQPTYTGYSARNCLGTDDPEGAEPTDTCQPEEEGPIGTLPWYSENGLVSDGDPALAFGPVPDGNGDFSWDNGSRLYYANLTGSVSSNPSEKPFKGVEAIGVSRTDDVETAALGGEAGKAAWMPPVTIDASMSNAAFADKEQIWADNAATSDFFGNVYVCFANYKGGPSAGSAAHTLTVARSTDGGDTWSRVIVEKNNNSSSGQPFFLFSGPSGCTIRTDSDGKVFVFWAGWDQKTKTEGIYLSTSSDGGATFTDRRRLFRTHHTGVYDPVLGRNTMDGIAGARSDLSNAPSVDIANGAPDGTDATDRIVLTWVDGARLNDEHVKFTSSADGGRTWGPLRNIEQQIAHPDDRGYYSAPAISPDGQDVYLVYNAWLEHYKRSTIGPQNDRPLVGVLAHADVASTGVGPFSQVHRSTPGDARGSSQNDLTAEFLGDYVYAVATRDYGAAVWNDVRNAADCPAIDAWRMSLRTGDAVEKPEPNNDCPATFGNSDIFGVSVADPTP